MRRARRAIAPRFTLDAAHFSIGIVLLLAGLVLLFARRFLTPGRDRLTLLIFAAMPMLLGRATAGANAAANFEANTGTANYVAFLLIGSSVFMIVS